MPQEVVEEKKSTLIFSSASLAKLNNWGLQCS